MIISWQGGSTGLVMTGLDVLYACDEVLPFWWVTTTKVAQDAGDGTDSGVVSTIAAALVALYV
jgi:hypothetical protein